LFYFGYSGITNRNGSNFTGSREYELQVPNDPSKTVKITYDTSSGILTFTKNGKSDSEKILYPLID